MTTNGVIALILRYFTEFDSFAGRLHHNVGKISSLSYIWQNCPMQQSHGLFATAKLLVQVYYTVKQRNCTVLFLHYLYI